MDSQSPGPPAGGFFAGKRPRVIGHRGSCGTCPENTILSFQQAVADGADILEMDIHLSRDGEIIVIHDPTVDRTTDGTGAVADRTFAELRELDAGYCFTPDKGKTFPFRGQGINIPTLVEVLEAFPTIPLNIEVKVDNNVLVDKFLDLIRHYNRLKDVMVVAAAYHQPLADRLRALEPRLVTSHSRWEVIKFLVCTRLHAPELFTPASRALQVPLRTRWVEVVTPNFVRYAHQRGMEVHVWTINEEAQMKRLLAMGVDALFSDFPGRLRKLVDSGNGKRKPSGG